MIFDAHTHIFPDKVAEKAAKNIGTFYGYPMALDGRVESLLAEMDECGIDRALVHSVATTAKQTRNINDFIADEVNMHPDRFTGFMAMHQDTPDMVNEVERALGLGLKGVKIHPDIQQAALSDERFFPMYERIEGVVPLLAHTGDARYAFSNPDQVLKVLARFPKLTMICAHLGGHSVWDQALEMLAGTGVYVDTSSSLFWLSPEKAVTLIRAFGADRVLFGTDFPMWTAKSEMERFDALPLTQEERRKILWDNAASLLL